MNKITSLGFAVLLATTSTMASTMAIADANHKQGGMEGMKSGMSMGQGMSGMNKGMGMKQGACPGMSAEKMQMRQKMQARVMEIQKEPDLAKRQAMMKEHMDKMQAMMIKRRQAMQAEMMKITNEPDADKRMTMLKEHMAKGGMMNMHGKGMQGMMMNKSSDDGHSDHKH